MVLFLVWRYIQTYMQTECPALELFTNLTLTNTHRLFIVHFSVFSFIATRLIRLLLENLYTASLQFQDYRYCMNTQYSLHASNSRNMDGYKSTTVPHGDPNTNTRTTTMHI